MTTYDYKELLVATLKIIKILGILMAKQWVVCLTLKKKNSFSYHIVQHVQCTTSQILALCHSLSDTD